MKYYGAIREVNKKVYFLKKDSLIERKIYDFSLNLYDTTKIYYSGLFNKPTYNTYYFDTSRYGIPRKTYRYKILNPINSIYLVGEGYGNIIYSANEIDEYYPTRRVCSIRKNNPNRNLPSNYSSCYQQVVSTFISVNELNFSKQISVYPNPVKNKVTIVSKEEKVTSVSIVDIEGKVIKKIDVNSLREELDVSFLDKGVYLLQIETEKGMVVKKMVKDN